MAGFGGPKHNQEGAKPVEAPAKQAEPVLTAHGLTEDPISLGLRSVASASPAAIKSYGALEAQEPALDLMKEFDPEVPRPTPCATVHQTEERLLVLPQLTPSHMQGITNEEIQEAAEAFLTQERAKTLDVASPKVQVGMIEGRYVSHHLNMTLSGVPVFVLKLKPEHEADAEIRLYGRWAEATNLAADMGWLKQGRLQLEVEDQAGRGLVARSLLIDGERPTTAAREKWLEKKFSERSVN